MIHYFWIFVNKQFSIIITKNKVLIGLNSSFEKYSYYFFQGAKTIKNMNIMLKIKQYTAND